MQCGHVLMEGSALPGYLDDGAELDYHSPCYLPVNNARVMQRVRCEFYLLIQLLICGMQHEDFAS